MEKTWLDHKSRASVDHESPQCQEVVYKAIVASDRIHWRSGSGKAWAPLVTHSHSGQSWACVSMSRSSILNGAQEDEGGSEWVCLVELLQKLVNLAWRRDLSEAWQSSTSSGEAVCCAEERRLCHLAAEGESNQEGDFRSIEGRPA